MKRNSYLKCYILLIGWICLLIGFLYAFQYYRAYFINISKSSITSDYDISSYNISFDITKTNKIDVIETVVIDGIEGNNFKNQVTRTLPLWQVKYDLDGTLNYDRTSIMYLRAGTGNETDTTNSTNKNYSVSNKTNSQTITVNTDDVSLDGTYTYTFRYRYQLGMDDNIGKDVISFRLFDRLDNVTLDNVSVSVNLPEGVAGTVYLLDGEKKLVEEQKDLNSFVVPLSGVDIKDYLSVYIELPDNFFDSYSYNYGYACLIIMFVVVLIALVTFTLWLRFYLKHNKALNKLDYYIPEELDAVFVGYIGGENDLNKLTVGLLVALAVKGIIVINKTDEGVIVKKGSTRFDAKIMGANEIALYSALFAAEKEVNLNEFDFKPVYNTLGNNIHDKLDKRFNKIENFVVLFRLLFVLVCLAIVFIISIVTINDMDSNLWWLHTVVLAMLFAFGGIGIFLMRKFTYGYRVCSKIDKLRDFYENAVKDDLDLLMFDDHAYMDKSIPYVYILGCNNKIFNDYAILKYGNYFKLNDDGKLEQNIISKKEN